MKLINPQKTIAVIQSKDFSFQKKFGQNFLIDAHVLDRILEAAEINKDDYVIEIGPGIGTLTEAMAERAGHVTAIEIDSKLIPILEENLAGYDNIDIINEDVLKVDLEKLVRERNDGKPVKVVANLPYYITTPIVMGLFEKHVPMERATIMVQKEVADRMQAGPGTKDYGALSLAVQFYAQPVYGANVPPNCFIPRPKVGSAIISLITHKKPTVLVKDEKLLFDIIHGAFEQRRKTLVNALSNTAKLSFSKEEITTAIEMAGFNPLIRGEALELSEFAKLTDILFDMKEA